MKSGRLAPFAAVVALLARPKRFRDASTSAPAGQAVARIAGWGLLALALLPFGASLAFHAREPQPQPGPQAMDRASLVFQQYLVNLREIEPTREATADFAFTNTGRRPVTITALEPSCGCLQPRLDKRTYAPGESGIFSTRIQTATEKPGPKEYTITVRYSDPTPRETRLTFKVTLPERQIVVEPRGLMVYQFGEAAPVEREIMVTDLRGRALLVTSAQASTAWATARVAGSDEDANGHHRTRIVVTVREDVPAGVHHGHVTIRTTDPEFSQLVVPLSIERRETLDRTALQVPFDEAPRASRAD